MFSSDEGFQAEPFFGTHESLIIQQNIEKHKLMNWYTSVIS